MLTLSCAPQKGFVARQIWETQKQSKEDLFIQGLLGRLALLYYEM